MKKNLIPSKAWQNYIKKLAKINTRAAGDVVGYMVDHDVSTHEGVNALMDYAYAVSTKYGEAAAELSCQMYDAIAIASKAAVPAAEPAATATYGEIAKTIYGTLASTKNPDAIGAAVGRSVKLASVDTMQQNALRDGAEWAWIPSGDSCPFCIMLASRGWKPASKKVIKNGHAEHIHNNCDCTYCVRFDHETTVEGYGDGEEYRAIYKDQEGIDQSILDDMKKQGYDLNTPKGRMAAMRRQHYVNNREYIRAQQNAAYARRNNLPSGAPEFASSSETPSIDYASSHTFAKGDVDLMNALRSGDCQQVSDAVNTILESEEYELPKSNWSGKTRVASLAEMAEITGRKEPWCSITIREDQMYNIKTFIHENLHSRSYSRVSESIRETIYKKHWKIEEATVELLSQEICKKNNIKYGVTYTTLVDSIKEINKILNPNMSDYDFAKQLIAIPIDKRYNQLERMVNAFKRQSRLLSHEVEETLNKSLESLASIGI